LQPWLIAFFIMLSKGYYVPVWAIKEGDCGQVENCRLLFELIEEAGLQRPNCRPEEIADGDLKAILRTLYTLFSNYKERD
jgi:parvin